MAGGDSLGGVTTWVAFFLITLGGLVGGGFLDWLVEHKLEGKIPYTVVVFMCGAVLGIILFYCTDAGSPARAFIDQSNLVADVILYLFLPVLIFSESMSLNWHRTIRALNQSLWLAGPGVVIGCMLTAVSAFYINEWSFHASCVFGAILSATDPVAVVALLKTTGAPSDLTMLIVGESLLNDGSAIFLYQLFVQIAQPSSRQDPASIIEFFLENACGSVCFGVGIGLVTNWIMRRLDNPLKRLDMTVQVAITIGATYVSFVVAQEVLHISGVLSASAAGLIVARFAPPFILHHRAMHRVWNSLEWMCNTLIFYYAGFSAADRAIKYCEIRDAYMIVVFYCITMIVRTVMIALLYPILRRGKLPITFARCLFINWSGLRGALAIALVLSLESSKLFREETRHQIFLQTVGVVALTLLINGTTSKYLLNYLKLSEKYIEDEDIAQLMKTLVIRRLTKAVDEKLLDSVYGVSTENVADKYCSYLNSSTVMNARDTFSIKRDMVNKKVSDRKALRMQRRQSHVVKGIAGSSSPPESPSGSTSNFDNDCDPYLLDFLRKRFYDSLQMQYHMYVSIGKIPRSSYSAHVLLFSLDGALEVSDKPVCDWQLTLKHMESMSIILWLAKALDDACASICCTSPGFYNYQLSEVEKRQIYIVSNFIDAHKASQKKIASFLAGTETTEEWLAEELTIKEESEREVEAAKVYLSSKFDETSLKEFWEQSAARVILHEQKEIVKKMVSEHMLSKSAATDLLQQIDADGFALEEKRIEMHRIFVKNRAKDMKTDFDNLKKSSSQERIAGMLHGGKKALTDPIPNPLLLDRGGGEFSL